MSATRAACCMLWVTITIVKRPFRLCIRSSIEAGRDRVEGRGGLVEQQHVRFDRDRPGDAEPLLLAAGEAERAVLEPVLDLVPERRSAQRLLDPLVELVLQPEVARRPGDVVVDRLRERVRFLEDHADPPPHLDPVDVAAVEIVAVVEDPAARS